jgi:hypothetical protein
MTNGLRYRRTASSTIAPKGELATDLVAIWPAFVNCRARLRTLIPFLGDHIKRSSRVIDLAAGIGCEVSALAELGYRVTANEVNAELRRIAIRRTQHMRVTWTQSDWRVIATDLGHVQFGTLLLLGNSFPLLITQHDRQRALEQFFALSDADGIFICDLRNFDYILREREAILKGNFRYSRRVMYCGQQVTGRPIAISSSVVTFGYFDKSGRQRGTLDMVPLSVDEMVDACKRAGFQYFDVFSDFKPGLDDSADFFTFVFRR